MANGVNKVILIGNLGRDPEIIRLESGVKKASFTLATTEVYKNKEGEKTQHTEWHNIVLWRGLAEIAENYLKKGSTVYIEGRIRRREWEDKDGLKRYATDIMGDAMTMLGGGPGRREMPPDEAPAPISHETNGNGDVPEPSDDLPF
ncbi:MAG: single-stranded DNA-binding protein [Bacteroidota bacterium]|nr:single-stranded DNA-binding protein [Bacteroidota bacterium]